ncbi:pH-response regulator protein palC [Penicillium macrosclerotiorum]|uniref:pH-response regulator protein palC n=1 Tax=Penicillium macrosclerotiorum TaxID=303699 RepID=UPI0025485E58|nr:pH-response regulator protein palC [Penicillium macrosclerotiorum]KAJ5698763.1 pH-response regulator protein palC [Penicillium macrosclerotiorum]
MVYAFTLPTTSPLSFQTFISSSTHPSLPQAASTARHALRIALKAHKRLPRGSRQDAHLPTVLAALNEYIPYVFTIAHGLTGRPIHHEYTHSGDGDRIDSSRNMSSLAGEHIEITLRAEIESSWKPTLSAGNILNTGGSTGISTAKSFRPRGARVSGQGIDFEIAFTLTTLGYVLSRLARVGVVETLYAATTQTAEQRLAAVQNATRNLLHASSAHGFLASSPALSAATTATVPDLDASTQSALSSLALSEATLLAVMKDDAYVTACIQSRNPNDREWMVRAPEIPKVRALLFARLCVRAAEYAEQANAGLSAVGSGAGRSLRVDEEVIGYAGVLGRVARARACRFFGIDAELAGKTGEGIAWLRAARTPLGLRGGSSAEEEAAGVPAKSGFSRLKREWTERREERKIGKDAGSGHGAKGALDPGDDAGRSEERQVITMLETKWVKMNDTINTQPIPPSAPLLANLPSGRDIHTPPAPYKADSLDREHLMQMRAQPDERLDLHFGSDPDDSDEEPVSAGGRCLLADFLIGPRQPQMCTIDMIPRTMAQAQIKGYALYALFISVE